MTKIYLVRHAESESNRRRTFTGQLDIGLTDKGKEQARRLAAFLRDIPIDAVISSDLSRVVATVAPTAEEKGLVIRKDPTFREIYGAAFEGRTYEEIGVDFPAELSVWLGDIDHGACPGGESVSDVRARVLPAVIRLAATYEGKTLLLATHATPIRTILSYATGRSMQELRWVPNASTSLLTVEGERISAVSIGDVSYLGDLTTVFGKGI